MLLAMPYSTEVHDGRIRMGAVVIMAVCIIVHALVQADNRRVERIVNDRITEFARSERLLPPDFSVLRPSSPGELESLIERFRAEQEARRDSVYRSLREAAETGLLYRLGVVPARLSVLTLLTYMFVHGGWIHLLGNLLFFYVCGVAMEKYWGLWRFVGAYLGCGVSAALVYVLSTAFAPHEVRAVPLVGASGAIAGTMGAFMVTHGRVRVNVMLLVLWFRTVLRIRSAVYCGLWFAGQVALALFKSDFSSGIAYTAHVGGFVMGVVLGRFLRSEDDDALMVPAQVMRALARAGVPCVVQRSAVVGAASPKGEIPYAGGPSVFVGAGREALARGDGATAAQCLCRAMEMLVREPDENRLVVAEAVALLTGASASVNLPIPAAQYYHWGRSLAQAGHTVAAGALLDTTAAIADTPYLRKNSLLAAAELRIRSGFQLDRAADNLRTVIRLDGGGFLAQQAQRLLSEMSAPPDRR